MGATGFWYAGAEKPELEGHGVIAGGDAATGSGAFAQPWYCLRDGVRLHHSPTPAEEFAGSPVGPQIMLYYGPDLLRP